MIKNIFPSKISEIGEQKSKFADGGEVKTGYGGAGGYLVGRPHSKGGIKAVVKSTNQNIEVEGGEVIITKPAVEDRTLREFEGEMLTNRQILSRINQSGGGIAFADGGEVPHELMLSGKPYKYGGKTMSDRDIVRMMALGGVSELPTTESINLTLKSVGFGDNQLANARIVQRVLSDIDVPCYILYGDAFYNTKKYSGRIWVELPDGRVIDPLGNQITGNLSQEKAFEPSMYEVDYYGSNYDLLPLLSDEAVGYAYGGELIDPKKARQILRDGTVHGKPLTRKQERFMYASANQKMSLGGIVKEYFNEDGDRKQLISPDWHGGFRLSMGLDDTLGKMSSNNQRIADGLLSITAFFEKMKIINDSNSSLEEFISIKLFPTRELSWSDLDVSDLLGNYLPLAVTKYNTDPKYFSLLREGKYDDSEYDKFFDGTIAIKATSMDKFLAFIELKDITSKNGEYSDENGVVYSNFDDLYNSKKDEIDALFKEKEDYMKSESTGLSFSVPKQKRYAKWVFKFLFGEKYMNIQRVASFLNSLQPLAGNSSNYAEKVKLIQEEIENLSLLKSDIINITDPLLYAKVSREISNLYDVLAIEREKATPIQSLVEYTKKKYMVKMPIFAEDRENAVKSKIPTPFGTPSQLTVEDAEIVRSSNFKLWFGDWEMAAKLNSYDGVSQVYNQQTGEPLVVYQGDIGLRTRFAFRGFPVNYFASNYSYSRWFAENTYTSKGEEYGIPATIYSFFLRMINPIDLREFGYEDGKGSGWIEIFARILDVEPNVIYPNFQTQQELDAFLDAEIPLWAMLRNNINLLEYIKKNTLFDGIIMVENNPQDIVNGEENFTDSYMIFENENIKTSNASLFNTITTMSESAFDDFRFKRGGIL